MNAATYGRFGPEKAWMVEHASSYANLFNSRPPAETEQLITDACVDPFWSPRTNLINDLADRVEDLALVLKFDAGDGHYYSTVFCYEDGSVEQDTTLLVRYQDGAWAVDESPVDWDALWAAVVSLHVAVRDAKAAARVGRSR